MAWRLIPDGPYTPFHDLTYASPTAALGCLGAKPDVEPTTSHDDQGRSVPSWYPTVKTVMETLGLFEGAREAVANALHGNFPEDFAPSGAPLLQL